MILINRGSPFSFSLNDAKRERENSDGNTTPICQSSGVVLLLFPISSLKQVSFVCTDNVSYFSPLMPVAPVAQRYHVTSDTLGREFDPGNRDVSH